MDVWPGNSPDESSADARGERPEGISHDAEAGRFELRLEDGTAFVDYELRDAVMDLRSTWVPDTHRNRGVGERVVVAALEHARTHGYRVVPTCPFVPWVLDRNPEYADLVEEG